MPGWAGTSGDWIGTPGVSYDGTLNWPVSLEATRTVDTISLFTGLWGITGSASSEFQAKAFSSGAAGPGEMSTSVDIQFAGKSASLGLEGANSTTLACDALTTTGSATSHIPLTRWQKTINPLTLIPGLQSAACGLSGFLCSAIQSVGIKASADATLSGTATYTDEGAEIQWDGGSLGGSLSGRVGAGLTLPPPLHAVAGLSVHGGGTGCLEFQVAPSFALQTLGGELEASANVSFFGLSASASETWPFGDGCGGESGLPEEGPTDAFIPADGELAMAATEVGGEILGVAVWSEVPVGGDRPSSDIAYRLFSGDAWGPIHLLTSDVDADVWPSVAIDGDGQILIVYGRSEESLPSTVDDLSVFVAGYELRWAEVDPLDGLVTATGTLTANNLPDLAPRLIRDAAGGLHVFWQQIDGLEIAGSTVSPISIHQATWNGGSWGATQTVASGLEKVWGWTPGADSETSMLVGLTFDEDGDFSTGDDREIYEITKAAGTWLAPRRITENATMDDAPLPTFTASGEPLLLWRRGAEVMELRGDLFAVPEVAISLEAPLPGEVFDGALAHGLLVSGAGGEALIWPEGEALHFSSRPASTWSSYGDAAHERLFPESRVEIPGALRDLGNGFLIFGYGTRQFEAGQTSVAPLIEPHFVRLPLQSQVFADDFESGETSAWTVVSP